MTKEFLEAAKDALSFLEGAGFQLTASDAVRVRYESQQAFVTMGWDPRSGELDVFLGRRPRKGGGGEEFSLTDLLDMQDVNEPERRMPFQVADEALLKPFIDKLAEDVRVYAQPALTGDRLFFQRLRTFRHSRAQAQAMDLRLRTIRAEAEQAWHQRDLDRVIELYAAIEDRLTAAEKAKLTYAKKKRR